MVIAGKYSVVSRLSKENKTKSVFYQDGVRTLAGINTDEYSFSADTLEEILTHIRLNNLHKGIDKITITFPNG